jgi:SAM-dependent methyltransferase
LDRKAFEIHAELEEAHWWFRARRKILRAMVDEATGKRCGLNVVDIGCGVGATLSAFAPDHAVVGYDPSLDAIEFAKGRHPGFDLRIGNFESAGPSIASADVVLLNDVIEHVPDDRALLAPIIAQMKPGGILVVTVPADMKLWSQHDVSLGHYRRYDMEMLLKATVDLPVEEMFVSHFNSNLYPLVLLARSMSRALRSGAGSSRIDIRPTPRLVNRMLEAAFAREAGRLTAALKGRAPPFRRGVSLMGIYRRIGKP